MSYTLAQVRDLIKQRCNLENTSAQTNTEILNHINDAAAYTHDFLIATLGESYARKTTSVTQGVGVSGLPVTATDFYKPIRVSLVYDGVGYPLRQASVMDTPYTTPRTSWGPATLPDYYYTFSPDGTIVIDFTPANDSSQTVYLDYHTKAPTYSTDADLIKIPHPDLLIVEACLRVKDKDERDSSRFMQERALIQKRIEDWVGSNDMGNVSRTLRTGRYGNRRRALPDGRLF